MLYIMSTRIWLEGTNCCEEFDWEDLTSMITTQMNKINPGGYWKARVKNFGWRSQDGETEVFKAMNGADLLSHVLPKTECSFKIYKLKNGFKIDNAHHDKPMGGEIYMITKARSESGKI